MLITYCENKHQIQVAKESGLSEVILTSAVTSTLGKSDLDELKMLCKFATELEMSVSLEFDIIITENELSKCIQKLEAHQFFELITMGFIKSVRVRDLGLLNYLYKNTEVDLYFISEGHNHNLSALLELERFFGKRLKRLILSIELSLDKLIQYKNQLRTQIEFLVLGKILLFYTPRELLSPLLSPYGPSELKETPNKQQSLNAIAKSEESPHRGFPVVENKHGTFMFHIKHQFVLDHYDELGVIDFKRVDLRECTDFSLALLNINKLIQKTIDAKEFKLFYPYQTMRGFFKVNKSNVLFKKLKNQRIQRKDNGYIGEIIDAKKPHYQVLELKGKHNLKLGDKLRFVNPEGKVIDYDLQFLTGLLGEELKSTLNQNYIKIKYHPKLWVRSQAYLDNIHGGH